MFDSKSTNELDCSLLEQLGYWVTIYDQQWRPIYSCKKTTEFLTKASSGEESSNQSLKEVIDAQNWSILKSSATSNDGKAHLIKLPALEINLIIRCTSKEVSGNLFYILSSEPLETDSNKQPCINERTVLDVDKHLKLGFWRYGINNNDLLWSQGIYQIHGLSPDSFTPTLDNALAFYHQDDLPIIKGLVNDAISEKKPWHDVRLRIVAPDGCVRHVSSSGCFVQLPNSVDSFICGVFEDITEQQRVKNEHDFLVTALKETSVGMVIADHNKNVIWVNKSFEGMTGYTLLDVAGSKLGDVLQGKDTDPNVVNEISKSLRKGMAIKARILNYHKSGRAYWNDLSITPITKGSEIEYFFAVQNDVTGEVTAKHELQNLNSELEAQVESRTIELKSINQKLSEQANIDPLTGLLNRRSLNKCVADAQSALQDRNQSLSYILLDIDNFKQLNDRFGHAVGDQALVKVAKAMRENSRQEDKLFRLGGEEFLVVMAATNQSVALTVAERIRVAIASLSINFEGERLNITASFGILTDGKGLSVDESLKLVDTCLYKAKASGKNRLVSEVRTP